MTARRSCSAKPPRSDRRWMSCYGPRVIKLLTDLREDVIEVRQIMNTIWGPSDGTRAIFLAHYENLPMQYTMIF